MIVLRLGRGAGRSSTDFSDGTDFKPRFEHRGSDAGRVLGRQTPRWIRTPQGRFNRGQESARRFRFIRGIRQSRLANGAPFAECDLPLPQFIKQAQPFLDWELHQPSAEFPLALQNLLNVESHDASPRNCRPNFSQSSANPWRMTSCSNFEASRTPDSTN